jgi:hypothetical protein
VGRPERVPAPDRRPGAGRRRAGAGPALVPAPGPPTRPTSPATTASPSSPWSSTPSAAMVPTRRT